jgi:hypothetical protein
MNDPRVRVRLVIFEAIKGIRNGLVSLTACTLLAWGIMHARGLQMPWVGIGQILLTWPFLVFYFLLVLTTVYVGIYNAREIMKQENENPYSSKTLPREPD